MCGMHVCGVCDRESVRGVYTSVCVVMCKCGGECANVPKDGLCASCESPGPSLSLVGSRQTFREGCEE